MRSFKYVQNYVLRGASAMLPNSPYVSEVANVGGSDNSAYAYAIRWRSVLGIVSPGSVGVVDFSEYKLHFTYGNEQSSHIYTDITSGAIELPGEFTVSLVRVPPMNYSSSLAAGWYSPAATIELHTAPAFGLQEQRRLSLVSCGTESINASNLHNYSNGKLLESYGRVHYLPGGVYDSTASPLKIRPLGEGGSGAVDHCVYAKEIVDLPIVGQFIVPPLLKYAAAVFLP